MGIISKRVTGGGLADAIRCDEDNYLIWKWHPHGTEEDANNKENSVRWGSSLRVKDGQVAVFVYGSGTEEIEEFVEGPYDEILKTKNLPIISNIVGLAYAGGTPFPAEVYFINLAQVNQIRFAVPYFDVFDPRFLDFGVPVAVRGTINYKIKNYRDFIKLHRLETFTFDDFQDQVKTAISRNIKTVITNAPELYNIPLIQIERKIEQINEASEERIKKHFEDEFGVMVSGVDIAVIDIDKTSEGYLRLKAVTQDLTVKTMQAKTELDIKEMQDTQRLGVIEREGRIDTNIKEDAYAKHKQTQTANLEAYQIEAREHVGAAGACGLGLMGSHDGGNASGAMNPASLMAGLSIGNAIGQNIADNINGVMNAGHISTQREPVVIGAANSTLSLYNIAVDGKATGPFDKVVLAGMYSMGNFTKNTLVWTAGMPSWKKAEEIEDLQNIFSDMPPVPDQEKV